MTKEATVRIEINKLLGAAGWRFFADGSDAANIRLEPGVTIKSTDLDALGENFEKIERGFVDFLLLDAKGFPLLVLEAKAEAENPFVGKEQARKYARSQNCRFVTLSRRSQLRATQLALEIAPGQVGLAVRDAHGAALRAGIGAGDRPLGVNDTAVGRIAEYEAGLSRLPRGAFVALLVTREGRSACVGIDPGIGP